MTETLGPQGPEEGERRQGRPSLAEGCHDASTQERDPPGAARTSQALALKEAKFPMGTLRITQGKESRLAGLKELGLFTQTRGWLLPTYQSIRE